jgi:hemerythrin-like domain-containing protein
MTGRTAAGREMVQELLAAHAGLRRDLADLGEALRLLRERAASSAAEVRALVDGMTMRQNAWQLRSFCDFYCSKVHAHHTIEDSRIFPAVLRIAPELAPVVEQLEAEHRRLGALLNVLTTAVAALPGSGAVWTAAETAVSDLADHLETHLDREEENIIPQLGRLPSWV